MVVLSIVIVIVVHVIIAIALHFIHLSNPINRPHIILILTTPHLLTIKQHILSPKLPIIKDNTFQLPIFMSRNNEQTQRLLRIYQRS